MKKWVIPMVVGLMVLSLTSGIYAGGRKGSRVSTPVYYTEDDLESITRDYCTSVWYDNNSDSVNEDVAVIPSGVVDSGSLVAVAWKKKNAAAIKASYSGYIKRSGPSKNSPTTKTTLSFGSTSPIPIDWNFMAAENGDIIFIRSNSLVGKAVHLISSWTHTGMITNKSRHFVFDSMEGLVDIRNTDEKWGKVLAYGTKGVAGLNKSQEQSAISAARNRYLGTPYFPKLIDKNKTSNLSFLARWSSKSDISSAYCSKLVWLTFHDYDSHIDLDSNRTKWNRWDLANSDGSWIGVSPDDIWGSDRTTAAYDLARVDMLSQPTSDF